MATPDSFFNFRGTYQGVTVVHSKTYGVHIRAARGSKSEAKLNDAMMAAGERMISSNEPAKLIRDALAPYQENYYGGGQLWQKLVAHFAAQKKKGKEFSVEGIKSWNVHQAYPTSAVMYIFMQIDSFASSGVMDISLNYAFADRFLERSARITGFQTTVIMLFPDFINKCITTVATTLPVKLKEDKSPYLFLLDVPAGATQYLACVKADPCEGNEVESGKRDAYRVMQLYSSGSIDSFGTT